MCEDIADQRHDRAKCYLAADAVGRAVHLEEKCNGNHRTNSPANRSEDQMVETKRSENIAACHHEKTSRPGACELFGSRPGQDRPGAVHRTRADPNSASSSASPLCST